MRVITVIVRRLSYWPRCLRPLRLDSSVTSTPYPSSTACSYAWRGTTRRDLRDFCGLLAGRLDHSTGSALAQHGDATLCKLQNHYESEAATRCCVLIFGLSHCPKCCCAMLCPCRPWCGEGRWATLRWIHLLALARFTHQS